MDFLIFYDQPCSRIKYRDPLYVNKISPVSCLEPRYSPIHLGLHIGLFFRHILFKGHRRAGTLLGLYTVQSFAKLREPL